METPYVPHFFGADVHVRLRNTVGWLTAGVSSSIPWPQEDVLISYSGAEYLLRGASHDGKPASPCVSTPCPRDGFDEALARIYRFVSVLGWFKGGYVDVNGYTWSGLPIRYGLPPNAAFATVMAGGRYGFKCNHMPIVKEDQVRKALAFLREGRRLRHVHDAYAFLSFFKVLESQFRPAQRKEWIAKNLDVLDGDAGKRVAELRAAGVDVNEHLYKSGRCAVAHASLDEAIVDPDLPSDRRRIRDDLDIIAALAERLVRVDLAVPDERELHGSRDRVAPWHSLMLPEGLARLKAGDTVDDAAMVGQIHGATVAVRIWPDSPPVELQTMTLEAHGSGPGCVLLQAHNAQETIFLTFAMDVANGRMHVLVDECGATDYFNPVTEGEVAAVTHFVHSVIGNRTVELTIAGAEPVDCEVVIPVNIIPRVPEEAVAEAVEAFRQRQQQPVA